MPGFEVAGVEALDCKDVALPVAKAPPHVVVTGPADPGSVAPVMIPTPLLSNSAVELDVPGEQRARVRRHRAPYTRAGACRG
jgi:hypothetical protein